MIRLFVEDDLSKNQEIFLDEKQVHYLFHVMKAEAGENILCFDNKNGEFECEIIEISKKKCALKILRKTRDFELSSDIWLLFAPLKKDNTDFVVEKATELGVRRIVPVMTKRTNSANIKLERLRAQVIEAAEQCRRVDLPEVCDVATLEKTLFSWDGERVLFFMDESLNGENVFEVFSKKEYAAKSVAILVGPEGGFSEDEFKKLRGLKFAKAVTMGKRILRAETAAVAALSCWQAIGGDWKQGEKN